MITLLDSQLNKLASLMKGKQFAVLSGAGISTDSGIPDYRGPLTRNIPRNPVKHDEFIKHAEARKRYWSRASRGFATVNDALPNTGHLALAEMEMNGLLKGVITQNVDGLHQAAGSKNVIELHGTLHAVNCLACAKTYSRNEIQQQISTENEGWIKFVSEVAPDGDAEVLAREYEAFIEPACQVCRGSLMPDVIFFGGNVPKPRTQAALDMVAESDGLLVVGSSLTVYSGYRFVRHAERHNLPIAIATLGETRGHKHAQVVLDAPLGVLLPVLAKALKD